MTSESDYGKSCSSSWPGKTKREHLEAGRVAYVISHGLEYQDSGRFKGMAHVK